MLLAIQHIPYISVHRAKDFSVLAYWQATAFLLSCFVKNRQHLIVSGIKGYACSLSFYKTRAITHAKSRLCKKR